MMNVDTCINEIEAYLKPRIGGGAYSVRPCVVFVEHPSQIQRILQHFHGRASMVMKSPVDYASNGVFEKAEFYNRTKKENVGKFILSGITTCGCLLGKQEVRALLHHLFSLSGGEDFRMVVLCCNIMDMWGDLSPRELHFAIKVEEGMTYSWPKLCFLRPGLPLPPDAPCVSALSEMPRYLEMQEKSPSMLYVRTNMPRASFLGGMFEVEEAGSEYEILCKLNSDTRQLEEALGTPERWDKALALLHQHKSWPALFAEELGFSSVAVEKLIPRYVDFTPFQRWLSLLALKLDGGQESVVLTRAIARSSSMEELFVHLWTDVLEDDCHAADYERLYQQRKELLRMVPKDVQQGDKLVSLVWSKREDALFYLTDVTVQEQEAIFRYLSKFCLQKSAAEVCAALRHINPDLAAYMSPIGFEQALVCQDEEAAPYLERYFELYRMGKLMNHADDEMLKMVEEQSLRHNFYPWLKSRESVLSAISLPANQRTLVMFVDAMGVEFLGYIIARCREMGLLAGVSVARAKLPTITEFNKDFLTALQERGCGVLSSRALDKIKHEGKEHFSENKLPLYVTDELKVLNECLLEAKSKLRDSYKPVSQVILVADHGASRLAVLHAHETTIDCDIKATHGGRMVAIGANVSALGDKAVCSDDGQYYSIAGYELIRGGRRASVETHGGATLEEICVPIVTLTCPVEPVQVRIMNNPVRFSRIRRDAVLRLYITPRLEKSICVRLDGAGERIKATSTDGFNFSVELRELNQTGIHHVTVFADNAVLAENVEFNADSATAKTKKLF